MAFRFFLHSVLRLRRSQQRQQELLVQRASEQVNRMFAEVRVIEAAIVQLASSRSISEAQAAEMHFIEIQRRLLEERRRKTEFDLAKAADRHSELVADLRKLWQQREVLEALRKREYEIYAREQIRREQSGQDDMFLLRTRDRKSLPN